PRGGVYTGTGTGPDAAYVITFGATANMVVTMDPTGAQDMAVIVYTNVCSNNLADGIVIDDDGVGGAVETVAITSMPAGTYNIVVDGYSTGGTPPGPSGPYTLAVTGTVQPINPVAAGVNIGGRIVNANGIGINGTRVTLTYPSGEVATIKTNAFGYYKFEDLEVGSTYTVQVADKRHQFANPSQIVTLQDAVEDLNFTAQP
ncbi:MAG TPA: carboxypeptidase regulatory-like domain-containing protein, partial [Pyrinomonadaceae bacterium]|nr:carboxypeptidase regulatory-like domain-containing protein [Pyrinomonadaceae bacterium]